MGAELPSEDSMRRLADVGVALLDCEHRTPKAQAVGYPYIAIPNIRDGRLDLSDVRRISPEDYKSWTRKTKPQAGDIIVTRRARVGDTAIVPVGLNCAIGQNLVILRSTGQEIDQGYLRWALRGPLYDLELRSFLNVGAVFDSLNCADIPKFRIPVPPLHEQRAIAHVLGTLDDKIELNRRMNATLEEMARALFRSWFVDFDPVRAKAEGRQPAGMDAATAALFPDSFEETVLGDVPRGWRLGTLGDIARQERRGAQPQDISVGTPYIGLEHMPRKSISLGEWGVSDTVVSQKSWFRDGEILFGKLRPYFHKVGVAVVDGVCSTDIVVVAPSAPDWFGLTLEIMSSDDFVSFVTASSDGTKMPRTRWSDMARYEVIIPPLNVARRFNELITQFTALIRSNIFQSEALATIRDALLPKLLSGEIRVGEAARAVAGAG